MQKKVDKGRVDQLREKLKELVEKSHKDFNNINKQTLEINDEDQENAFEGQEWQPDLS